MDDRKGFGKRLKSAIKAAGLTQKRVSELLQINKDTISNYVRGATSPNSEMIAQLAQVLNTDAHWLVTGHHRGQASKGNSRARADPTEPTTQRFIDCANRILRDESSGLDLIRLIAGIVQLDQKVLNSLTLYPSDLPPDRLSLKEEGASYKDTPLPTLIDALDKLSDEDLDRLLQEIRSRIRDRERSRLVK